MKDREYYERLISDRRDRPLSKAEAEELKQAMQKDPELVQFEQEVMKQAGVVRSLPDFSTAATLKLLPERAKSQSLFQSFWNIRVSLPLPIVVLLLLTFAGFALFGMFTNRFSEAPETRRGLPAIEYVQIERLKPAKAVLIEPEQDKKTANKEAL